MMDVTTLWEGDNFIHLAVHDEASDSLVTLRVKRSHGTLMATTGLRGNWDVRDRPHRTFSSTLDAPDVSPEKLAERKARWYKHNSWRLGN